MKKSKLILSILLTTNLCWQSCNTKVQFTYSPSQPRVGQNIYFFNKSKKGNHFDWDFGDGTVSSMENPVKKYTTPGTYTVQLTISGSYKGHLSQDIIVADSIPTIKDNCQNNIIPISQNVHFSVQMYNANNDPLAYNWSFSTDNYKTLTSLNDSSCIVYFNDYMDSIGVNVNITNKTTNQSTIVIKGYTMQNIPTATLLLKSANTPQKIRLFSIDKISPTKNVIDNRQKQLLENASQNKQKYNDSLYTLETIKNITNENIEGFAIHMGKIYYRTAQTIGVTNLDGKFKKTIAQHNNSALCIDYEFNRVCWATNNYLMTFPLIQTADNRFNYSPDTLATINAPVEKMILDTILSF